MPGMLFSKESRHSAVLLPIAEITPTPAINTDISGLIFIECKVKAQKSLNFGSKEPGFQFKNNCTSCFVIAGQVQAGHAKTAGQFVIPAQTKFLSFWEVHTLCAW